MLPDGYPPLSIYTSIAANEAYSAMERFSDGFLRNNRAALEHYSSLWVPDPLHSWSRRWEYVFAYETLRDMADRQPRQELRVLDAGSGLTFFPHFLAARHQNISVQCFDCDPQVAASASGLSNPAANADSVSYRTQDISALGVLDITFDAIYSISVLEHCDQYRSIVAGFAQALKPGARLIVTTDVALGDSGASWRRARELVDELARWFAPDSEYKLAVGEIDEKEILTTAYARRANPRLLPWKRPTWRQSAWDLLRHGRLPRAAFANLTCLCMRWTRREA